MAELKLLESSEKVKPTFLDSILGVRNWTFRGRRVISVDRSEFEYVPSDGPGSPRVSVAVERVAGGLDAGRLYFLSMEVRPSSKMGAFAVGSSPYGLSYLHTASGAVRFDDEKKIDRHLDALVDNYTSTRNNGPALDPIDLRKALESADVFFRDDLLRLYDGRVAPVITHKLYVGGCLHRATRGLNGSTKSLSVARSNALAALAVDDNCAEAHYLVARAEFEQNGLENLDFVRYHLYEAGRLAPRYITMGTEVRRELLATDGGLSSSDLNYALAVDEKVIANASLDHAESAEAHYVLARAELVLSGPKNPDFIRWHCFEAERLDDSYVGYTKVVREALAELMPTAEMPKPDAA